MFRRSTTIIISGAAPMNAVAPLMIAIDIKRLAINYKAQK